MKKIIVVLFFVFASCTLVCAQELVSQEQFQKLIGFLNDENWQEAADLSKSYLDKIPQNRLDEDAAAIVRYMYITTQAGLMNKGKLTKPQAAKSVAMFTGQRLILRWHTFSLKGGLNYIQLASEKTDTLMVTATNRQGTEIFAFEYIIPAEKISLEQFTGYNGKMARIEGRLKSITTEGNILPRYRILLENAHLEIKE